MLDTGYLTKKQKEIYLDSLGFYVRRSYKMFEDPNYIPDEGVVKNLKELGADVSFLTLLGNDEYREIYENIE